MASKKNIKGITIEINGDVTKLDKALSQVDKDLNTTQKNLKEVDRLLKLDPGNVELLDQKQRLLAKAVEQTKKRYDTLKESLAGTKVDDDKAEVWAKKQAVYDQQISKSKNALEKLEKQMKDIEKQGANGLTAEAAEELDRLTVAATETRSKIENLQKEAARAYEEMGKPISQDNYDAIQRELAQTEYDMNEATKAAKEFETGASELDAGLSKVNKTGSLLNEILGKLGISMKDLTMAGVVGLAVVAIKEFSEWTSKAVIDAAAYADNLLTLSTSYGIATDKLQEYSYMAELTDTSLDTITGAFSKLTKSMDAARNGNEDVAQAFAKLNIRVTDSTGKLRDADEVFEKAIGGLSMIAEGTERDTIAWKLFGKSVQELNPLISAFTNGTIKELREESHRYNYVLSSEEVEALGAVDDAFQRLDKVMEMVKNRVALDMAPELVNLAEQLIEVATTVDWQQFGHDVARIIHATTPLIVDLATALARLSEAFVKLIDAVSSLPLGKNPTNWGAAQNIVSRQASGFPAYASGGVVAPNNPMLAIVGDNRTEREVISPESLIRQIVREEAAGLGGGRVEVVVRNPSTTDNQIVRELTPEIDVRTAQRGRVL